MTPCISFTILVGLALILFLLTVRIVIELMPSLIATAIRWKESLNLEASVKLSRDRNLIALCATVPFSLTAFAHNLYNPAFLTGFSADAQLWISIGIFGTFVIVTPKAQLIFCTKDRHCSQFSRCNLRFITGFFGGSIGQNQHFLR